MNSLTNSFSVPIVKNSSGSLPTFDYPSNKFTSLDANSNKENALNGRRDHTNLSFNNLISLSDLKRRLVMENDTEPPDHLVNGFFEDLMFEPSEKHDNPQISLNTGRRKMMINKNTKSSKAVVKKLNFLKGSTKNLPPTNTVLYQTVEGQNLTPPRVKEGLSGLSAPLRNTGTGGLRKSFKKTNNFIRNDQTSAGKINPELGRGVSNHRRSTTTRGGETFISQKPKLLFNFDNPGIDYKEDYPAQTGNDRNQHQRGSSKGSLNKFRIKKDASSNSTSTLLLGGNLSRDQNHKNDRTGDRSSLRIISENKIFRALKKAKSGEQIQAHEPKNFKHQGSDPNIYIHNEDRSAAGLRAKIQDRVLVSKKIPPNVDPALRGKPSKKEKVYIMNPKHGKPKHG